MIAYIVQITLSLINIGLTGYALFLLRELKATRFHPRTKLRDIDPKFFDQYEERES